MQEPAFAGTLDLESGQVKTVQEGAVETDVVETENSGQPPVETQPEGTSPENISREKSKETPPETTPPSSQNGNDYLKLWNEKAGTQFQTEDEVVEEIKTSRVLKEKLTDYEKKLKILEELDPIALDIDKARKSGIELDLYLDAMKMDVEKLDAKQALKEDFFRKNADLVATDREFANLKFEKDFKARFGKLSETLDVSGLDEIEAKEKTLEFNQELDFVKRSLNAESIQAKKSLSEWKKKHITIPDVPQQAGMTDEQIQQYYTQVDSFIAKSEKIEIPVGDKKFNFGLKDYAETLKTELRNPLDTLKKHGIIIEKNMINIDPVSLGRLLTGYHMGMNMAKPLAKWMEDSRNIELISKKNEQPAPSQTIAGGAPPAEDDLAMRFAKGIKAMREAQSQL